MYTSNSPKIIQLKHIVYCFFLNYIIFLPLKYPLTILFMSKVRCNACKKPIKASQYSAHAGSTYTYFL